MIGGSKLISVLLNIVKNKVIALLLGPSGFGLISALKSTHQLVEKFAALGVHQSAVRNIAQANGKNEESRLSKTVKLVRRLVLFTGLLGVILTLVFSGFLSEFTFGSKEYLLEIQLLSIIIFLNIIKAGQATLLQGTRRIKELAMMTIWSSVFGLIFSIPILYFFRLDGVIAFLIALAVGQYLISYLYARRVPLQKIELEFKESIDEAKDIFRLGLSFMGGGFITLLGTYLIKVYVIRSFDLEAAGIYQAATTISTMYIGVILSAMGKDFYPRLAAVAGNRDDEISIINDQIAVGIYLAAPGLLFTLALAPFVINILYTPEFSDAYLILQWMILGVFLQTISWPIGYLFISRGQSVKFFLIQLASTAIHLSLVFVLTSTFSLTGIGMAFFFLYLCHSVYMFILARKENQFYWSNEVLRSVLLFGVIFTISFIILTTFKNSIPTYVVMLFGLICSYLTLRKILKIMELDNISEIWIKVKSKFK